MNVPQGFARLKSVGGTATVRELAEWCECPKDPTDIEAEGWSRTGLLSMMAQLDEIGARQVSPGALDAVVRIEVRHAAHD